MLGMFFVSWLLSTVALLAYIQTKYEQGLREGKEIGWDQGRSFEKNGGKINFNIKYHYVPKESTHD